MLSFDMGGTTAKLCLIPNGEPTVGTDLEVAHYQRFRKGSGFPLKIQSIQMIEIGAGGGSIAAKNPLGLLDVGPRSAGALPGPAAYQRGGTEPTVTDADILLGYMGVESFVGGSFKVSNDAAREAMEQLADALDVSVDRCAWGIHDLVNESMSKAAAMHATDLGVDPRTLPMVAFGGAGPVHAYGIARKLGIKRIICPTGAGVTSAIGLLIAPVAVDLSASFPMAVDNWDFDARCGGCSTIWPHRAPRSSAPPASPKRRSPTATPSTCAMSGRATRSRLRCPTAVCRRTNFSSSSWTTSPSSTASSLAEPYRRPSRSSPGGSAPAAARTRSPARIKPRSPTPSRDSGRSISTNWAPTSKRRSTIITSLPVDQPIKGPAIVEQRESTAVVGPSGTAHVDGHGNLVINIL